MGVQKAKMDIVNACYKTLFTCAHACCTVAAAVCPNAGKNSEQVQDMIRLLISYGAKLDAENDHGETAVHVAAAEDNVSALAAVTQQVKTSPSMHSNKLSRGRTSRCLA